MLIKIVGGLLIVIKTLNWKIIVRILVAEELVQAFKKPLSGSSAYKIAYEAGFCGFQIQRALSKYDDVECIVVNAADVPTSDKEKKRKTDKIDARKISRELSKGNLKGIYIPDPEMEHGRSLVRQRTRLVQDQTRCKNRIWHLLMFSGLKLDAEKPKQYWSKTFIESLRNLPVTDDGLKQTLEIAVDEYLAIRMLITKATLYIRTIIWSKLVSAGSKNYCKAYLVLVLLMQ
jgi:transposase